MDAIGSALRVRDPLRFRLAERLERAEFLQ